MQDERLQEMLEALQAKYRTLAAQLGLHGLTPGPGGVGGSGAAASLQF